MKKLLFVQILIFVLGSKAYASHSFELDLQYSPHRLKNADFSSSIISETIFIEDLKKIEKLDKRKIRTSNSPGYLNATGKLITTFSNGDQSLCSANLVDTQINRASRILLTAEHCFSTTNTKGERLPSIEPVHIIWTTQVGEQQLVRNAFIRHKDKATDTAVLSLDISIAFSEIKPLFLATNLFEKNLGRIISDFESTASLVGYSSDEKKGQYGKILTYTEAINAKGVVAAKDEVGRDMFKISAVSYGGASGGAFSMRASELTKKSLLLDKSTNQRLFLGLSSTVARQGLEKDTLFGTRQIYGSPETFITSFINFLQPSVLELFEHYNSSE